LAIRQKKKGCMSESQKFTSFPTFRSSHNISMPVRSAKRNGSSRDGRPNEVSSVARRFSRRQLEDYLEDEVSKLISNELILVAGKEETSFAKVYLEPLFDLLPQQIVVPPSSIPLSITIPEGLIPIETQVLGLGFEFRFEFNAGKMKDFYPEPKAPYLLFNVSFDRYDLGQPRKYLSFVQTLGVMRTEFYRHRSQPILPYGTEYGKERDRLWIQKTVMGTSVIAGKIQPESHVGVAGYIAVPQF
jgi:hypothetical protein